MKLRVEALTNDEYLNNPVYKIIQNNLLYSKLDSRNINMDGMKWMHNIFKVISLSEKCLEGCQFNFENPTKPNKI